MPEHFGPPSGTAPKTGAGLVKVVLSFSRSDGFLGENVFGIDTHGAGPVDDATLTSVCNDFKNWWQNGDGTHSPQAQCGESTSLSLIEAKDLTVVDGTIHSIAPALVGADTGGDLAAGLTFAITIRTALSGRSHRGRSFVVGLTDNVLATGSKDVADSAAITDLLAAYAGLLTGDFSVNNAGRKLSIFSYSNNNAYRANIAATDVASVGVFDFNMDYQRRRAPGHNRHL